jgi:CubicO group peptidase (beta-lactamase class C family)
MALGNDEPMRRNAPTSKTLLVQGDRDLETERTRLAGLIDRFVSAGPAGCTTHPHTFFGPLTAAEWAALMYKHADHHLRQFGVYLGQGPRARLPCGKPAYHDPVIFAMVSRRHFVQSTLAASAWLSLGRPAWAAVKTDPDQADALVAAYLAAYRVPGLSLAYGRGDRIVFAQGYGLADRHDKRQMAAQSLLRIASVSKPFTSAAIFTLVEAGSLRTDDQVFGPNGILPQFTLKSHADWLQAITVEHLLTHTAGGWSEKEYDPMYRQADRDHAGFIQRALDFYPLEAPPGTRFGYSNFGYVVLGRVIEQASGLPYGDYVRRYVQAPLGIADMQLARKDPVADEVHYYGQGHPYEVPVELHDSNGGWIATATDLVRFALGVFSAADDAGAPSLLKPETLRQMTQVPVTNSDYACGWHVSPEGNCFHPGGFDGTASFLMHRHDGLAWAMLVNSRRTKSDMEKDLHKLSWDVARILEDHP